MSYAPQPSYHPPPQPKSGSNALVVVAVILVAVVFFGGILAVLAISGVRKYIANAKTAEARNSVRMISMNARAAYDAHAKVCPSASRPVPMDATAVRGKKYQSAPSDWETDKARDAGFSCIGFQFSMPQYYQYDYKATADGWKGIARGDLNGDGVMSTFESEGRVSGGAVLISPAIVETDPAE